MKIKELIIQNLYGKDYSLEFFDDLTILYGMNGSGKTTILDIIQRLLSGEIEEVLEYKFSRLQALFVNDNSKLIRFEITSSQESYVIEYGELKAKLIKKNDKKEMYINKREYLEGNSYARLLGGHDKYTFNEAERIWYNDLVNDIIREVRNDFYAVYIPVDRSVRGINDTWNKTTEQGGKIYSSSVKIGNSSTDSTQKRVSKSVRLAQKYYAEFERRLNIDEKNIQQKLENNMMKKLTEPYLFNDIEKLNKSVNIDKLESKLLSYNYTSEEIRINLIKLIQNFRSIDKIVQGDKMSNDSNKLVYLLQRSFLIFQLEKMNEVLKSTANQKRKLDEMLYTAKNIIDNINSFFIDTNKQIFFDSKYNDLLFNNIGSEEKIPLEALSSGEQQLVIFIIFAFITINNHQNSQLLIDEPELSLHIAWQNKLLPMLQKNNSKTQIIVATHSPDIIGSLHDKCIEVRGNRYGK